MGGRKRIAKPDEAAATGGEAAAAEAVVAGSAKLWIGAGIATGIGSAAIAAAMLYAGRARKKPGERKR